MIVLAILIFSTEKEILPADGNLEKPTLFIPTVNFETLKTEIPESQNYAKILVALSEPSKSIVKIPLEYTGTASKKTDYTTKSDTIIIEANQKLGFIELDIINDKTKEQDETILIELQNPVNANLGEKSNYSYTILNDDEIKKSKPRQKKHPKKGTKYTVRCDGYDLYQYYHDGKGGSYRGFLKKRNSTKCGFIPPKVDPRTFYKEIINTEDPNFYSSIFDDYFVTYMVIGKKINFKIFSVRKKRLIQELDFRGKINNLYYDNRQLFTNKGYDGKTKHHFIDIENAKNNITGGKSGLKDALKTLKFRGAGDESLKKIKLIQN